MASERARELRQDATAAEAMLWKSLRFKQLGGFRFRRQHPIGIYIVDFVCLERMLIVEVDGATHATDDEVRREEARTSWLEAQGYRVIRFWNDEVYRNLTGVLDAILAALEEPEPPIGTTCIV